mmetsp:Transcript_39112/g.54319  ORF Transcript_39112/g.54319 Transcript_39112/m.54319 type:complete len:456 (-) Transcript_39112:213-1580(-)|eukprot:CAMPEP_0196590954 /NCGR_PEP_ID=MMETSP1081-20130531/68046_1 /TAXON_ID=36882 /ORGANISM="Pyramimonas amylifera, Strain CCMP720" /LENGTH=455 /DNA_ID=CAMNT_0041914189 /DNA_START=117 /DNA_END=1484 /DNA_ORIENTATION=+
MVNQMGKDMGGGDTYTYATEPRPVANRRKPKYREPEELDEDEIGAANIMFDRRVIRGNTYAAQILPAAPPNDNVSHTKRRKMHQQPPGTPHAVEGRRHIDVQTDSFLEELTDTVPERDVNTQTDPFMDRPPTPLFIPMKIGVDAETQIEPGDLFDFDFEVEPILEVLVGKTLEQGLMEVMEEEELAAMRAHQEHFEQIRNAELVATQRMEAAEKRKIEEKERRLAQERDRLEREKQVREKVAAQTFARGYLTGLVGNVFDKLFEQGYFYDPVEKEVEESFMPWLQKEVGTCIQKETAARAVVDAVIEEAQIKMKAARVKAEEYRAQQKKQEEDARIAEEVRLAKLVEERQTQLEALVHMILYDLNLIPVETIEATIVALTPEPEPTPEPEEPEEGEEMPELPPPPPDPEPPTEIQVLDKLLLDGTLQKETIQEALLLFNMGDSHFTKDKRYVPEG